MRIKSVQISNYKSIIESGTIPIESNLTAVIGMTDAGKTSFLTAISSVDRNIVIPEDDLTRGTSVTNKFLAGQLDLKDILLFKIEYEVEEDDKEQLPDEFKNITGVDVLRYADGVVKLKPIGNYSETPSGIKENQDKILEVLKQFTDNFNNAVTRLAEVNNHRQAFENIINSFKENDFKKIINVDLSIQQLTNQVNTIPKDAQFQNEVTQLFKALKTHRDQLEQSLSRDPFNRLYELVPKPLFQNKVFDLEDRIKIDDFIADPSRSDTFRCVAVVSGLNPNAIQRIRNKDSSVQNSYLDSVAETLSKRLNSFWKQEVYQFKFVIKGATELTLNVIDKTTSKETSVKERSTGFKWWTAFFLQIASFQVKKSGTKIILLDNPASELHDEGKGDVLRFLSDATKSGNLQIIYSSHERALIDPWRIDRIRYVEKTDAGTKIQRTHSGEKGDLINKIRRSIGSPARYSLFGGPRTILFEGESDMNFFSAFNEHFEQKSKNFLNKDLYSINAINGVSNAPQFCSLYKNLGLDFLIVVDSGTKTRDMQKELEKDDFKKYFLEMSEYTEKNESDIEDLIEPKLYHHIFTMAYKNILKKLPTLEEIENKNNNDKKTVMKYLDWFEENGLKKDQFNKVLISRQMIEVLLQNDKSGVLGELIANTEQKFLKLIEGIENKFSTTR